MQLFDISLKLSGYNIKKARAAFSALKSQARQDTQSYQYDKRRNILSYHLTHNPFYKSIAKFTDLEDWHSVPVLTKQDLQQPLKNRLSNGFNEGNVYINKTSGSSGHPFIFAKDKWSHSLTWAEIMDRFSWYNIDFNTSKQARFYGIPLKGKNYYKERVKDMLSNRYRFSIFDLSEKSLEDALIKFRTTPFDYINGYTSVVVQFARFLKSKGLVLNAVCPSLKVCVVTAEMLFENDRTLLESVFGVPVVNEYGASELGLIAFQNLNNEWQLNTETLYIEVLDDTNQPVPMGKEGRIVITSLFNKAHPFIRYDIGDVGAVSVSANSGAHVLKQLVGRTNDIAVLPSGKKAAGLTFYYITKSVIEDDGNVSEFIIEQQKRDTFKIVYCSKIALTKSKKNFISQEMEAYLEPGLTVNFERVEQLIRSESGKLKQFNRLF